MTVRSCWEAWNRFFFTPQSPLPVAIFRIFYGLLTVANLLLLRGDWFNLFGTHSIITWPTIRQLEPGTRLNLFALLPPGDNWTNALFWFFLVAAICLTAGLATRLNTILVFLCLVSIQQRDLFVLHGGDTFMRVSGFFLCFAPAGAALSLDKLIRKWRGRDQEKMFWPYAQRMIQIELALLYIVTSWWKSTGDAWINGTAIYYVNHLEDFRRFPVPSIFSTQLVVKMETWFTLVAEFSLGTLIWFRDLRYPLLLFGICFHLYLDYALNVPLFQWEVISAYVLFVDAGDLQRWGNNMKKVGRKILRRLRKEETSQLSRPISSLP